MRIAYKPGDKVILTGEVLEMQTTKHGVRYRVCVPGIVNDWFSRNKLLKVINVSKKDAPDEV